MISLVLALALGAAPAGPAPAASGPAVIASGAATGMGTEPQSWAITDVTVIPTDTDEILPHQTVLVRDGRITGIEPHLADANLRGVTVIDGRGKFLIPGLVDAHAHLPTEGAIRASKNPVIAGLDLGLNHDYERHVLLTLLKAGVTGVANLGGSAPSDESLLWLRDEIGAGRLVGPRLFIGKRINGPRADLATTPPASFAASSIDAPTTAEDGAAAVRQARRRGYDFIKPYQFLNRQTYRAVVEEARRQGMITTGHLPEIGCGICADRAFAFAHPMDNIAHAEELGRYGRASDLAPSDIDALADLVASRKTMGVTPSLITLKTIVHMYVNRQVPPIPGAWEPLVDPVTRLDWHGENNRYLSQAFRDQEGASTFSAGYDFARMLTRALWKRGVPLTVGTDAALPGLAFGVSVHQEMIELREIGLSPIEVLRAATINARRLFNAKGSGTGAVRVGERADLVLLDADPVADIQNISKVAGVFVDGRWLSSRQIDDLLAQTTRFNRDLGLQIQSRRQPDRAAK